MNRVADLRGVLIAAAALLIPIVARLARDGLTRLAVRLERRRRRRTHRGERRGGGAPPIHSPRRRRDDHV